MVARSIVVIVNCINLGSATTIETTTDRASFGSASMGSSAIAACTTPVLYGISIRFDIGSAIMGGSDVNIGSSTGSATRDTIDSTTTDGANKKLGAEVF